MALEIVPSPLFHGSAHGPGEAMRARWARLAEDYGQLESVAHLEIAGTTQIVRDVGELLLHGHDDALADAERYVVLGHTIRTGHVVDCDDVDDREALDRWVRELEQASADGHAPPAPQGFWASFLRWRTPLGMARLTERRIRTPLPRRAS
jgi:hypothetical protein